MLWRSCALLTRGTKGKAAMLGHRLRKDVVTDFINSSHRVWGTQYDYTIAEWKHANVPVKVVCREHGAFSVTPQEHLHKQKGCPRCFTERRVRRQQTQSVLPPSPGMKEFMEQLAPGRRRFQKSIPAPDSKPPDSVE